MSSKAPGRPPGLPFDEPPYLRDLNPEQREAVEALDGPVLVLAGAGTGKTRVLTARLAHILATRRAFPGQILSVTFTNKAAREMKERVALLIGGAVEGLPWLGTFHSIGARILRRHAELVGLKPSFTILDTDDQIRLIKQLLEAEDIDEKRWPARLFAGIMDGWKNRGLTPDKVPSSEGHHFANGMGLKLYAQYQARLKSLNAADFGDLLLEGLRLLQENPMVLDDYRRRFVYMLVDEYQDTNTAQYLWLRLLAGNDGNLCCVGDDDQSIYGWRGAEVDNILRFEKDFPGAKVIRLERNYRSTPEILAAASGLITANRGRLGKTLWTEAGSGERIRITGHWDSEAEARVIGDNIEDLQRQGEHLADMAILVRASYQMREFEDRFVTLGIPYRVIGGPRFYERQEIRDALAYLRLVNSPSDDLAFERIINRPKRGIGDATIQTLHLAARAEGIPLLAAARRIIDTDELGPRIRTALKALIASFDRWTALARTASQTVLAETVLDESGYTQMWQNDKSPDAPGRLDNLKELVRSMEPFENLAGFLEHVSLVMEAVDADTQDKISLMTLHAAKGLEFDTVFLPGWEEGLFPSQRTMDESGIAGLEEERRLAYVGLTRAKKRAQISFVANRRIHGSWAAAIPSRFIDEIPKEMVETEIDQGLYGGYEGYGRLNRMNESTAQGSYETPGWKRFQAAGKPQGNYRAPPTIEGEARLIATSDPAASRFSRGERVFHQKFGYGRITMIDGNKLTVDFEKAGEKRVVDSFVQRV
jgi:DNA helicase-2/ATP-dependent DNA helicase PcrA